MTKVPEVFLKHILESINDIENYTKDVTEKSFLAHANKEKQDAVVRRIEIIGEAVRNLPEEFKQNHPVIEWREIAGMRHKIELIWDVVENDLPVLKKRVDELLMEYA